MITVIVIGMKILATIIIIMILIIILTMMTTYKVMTSMIGINTININTDSSIIKLVL